ncbi:ABC transporter ATP-binding protein [Rhodococcus sp. (in: high G+C Gram-positive bacteria)]|uniref:ABC transporter ATP-binding protein n=1 Tax=Rhodococcus sp. TaxID=1831 RepID=UPI00257B2BB8|nr:ABC transporter ATP-binding protein [Rhodococcus sp. (in: high G+C Gram-positive bacteria)]MBQ9052401.1 ABC transporter ATP-binding protein [Rhodococcus sp. (in: high G+C Gram-positive bacteria)]
MLLETEELSVSFGGVKALDGAHLSVAAGEVVGLIGPNGAGKTTFIDAVTGFVPSMGRVMFDGNDIAHLAPHRRARTGVVRTFQQLELYQDLSVADNIRVAAKSSAPDPSVALLERFGLERLAQAYPEDLSHGHQRLVGIARALASEPHLLLLDEPAAGLDSSESIGLVEPIRALAAEGIGVLLIDHDVDLVFAVCDRVYVLDFGKVIGSGTPAEVGSSEVVRTAYLGASA